MNTFRMRPIHLSVIALLALALQGCNVKWEVVQDPYPNFHLIERRANSQDQQIGNAVQADQLARPFAQSLSDNVDLIRHLAWEYQNQTEGQTSDLTAPQTRFLGILLNDNQAAINDALTRQSQWANAFQGGWNYDFGYRPDRLLFIAVLHHQLVEQEAMVEDASNNGSLNSYQVADLRSRIQIVREAEWDDYNQNGSLDLNRDQMEELSQMVDDNYRYLRFRAQYSDRRWSGDHFDSWGQYKKDFAVTPSTLPKVSTTNNKYWDGRTARIQNSSHNLSVQGNTPTKLPPPSNSGLFPWVHTTPTAAPAPPAPTPTRWVPPAPATPTPVPQVPGPSTQPANPGPGNQANGASDNDHGNNGRHLGQEDHGNNGLHLGQGDQGNHPATGNVQDNNANPGVKADKVQASNAVTVQPSTPNAQAVPTAAPTWINPDALNHRFEQLGERMDQSELRGRERAELNRKKNEFRQSLNRALQQNQHKGLTQAQVNQLSKLLDDLENSLPTDNGQ